MQEDVIRGLVEPIMNNCLAGSNEENHTKHVRDFTEIVKNIVTHESLKMQLSQKPGTLFTSREFIYLGDTSLSEWFGGSLSQTIRRANESGHICRKGL